MTHLETERLVRKLVDLLQQRASSDLAPKLAGDYAAACHAANLRLQQCEAMIKAGDRHQAIQLAETSPILLDLVTVLEFRQADEWRSLCQQNALPVAERIDGRSVHALNECYALGITTDHPLYAAYRKAVLHRNDEEALTILQSIARLNPADANAASELARLDAKVLSARLENLNTLVTGGDAESVTKAIEAIESFGFRTEPDGEIWRKGELIRCGVILEQAEKLRPSGAWGEALSKIEFIQSLKTGLKFELSRPEENRLEELRAWAKAEAEKDRKNREFNSLLAELHFRIHQSEEKDTSARYVKLPELKDDSEGLHKVWRALTDFARPIPDEASAAFRKRSSLIDGEIGRRTAIRRRIIVIGSATALLVAGVIFWFAMRQMRANDFARQMRDAVTQRQVRTAEQLASRLQADDKAMLSFAKVNAALADTKSFLTKETALLKNFESIFEHLPSKLDENPNAAFIDQAAGTLVQAKAALNSLAPDLKSENQPRMDGFEKQWHEYLLNGGTALNQTLATWVATAESMADKLDYRSTVEVARSQCATLSDYIQKIDDCVSSYTNHVALRSDLIQRAAALDKKYATFSGEFRKIHAGMEALKSATTFSAYRTNIDLISSSEFSSAPPVAAAMTMQTIAVSEESALRLLLNATNPAMWEFLKKGVTANFIPEIALPVEKDAFDKLYNDPAVNADHHHYKLWLNSASSPSLDWVTAGTFDQSEGWKTIYVWVPSTSETTVTFHKMDYGCFNGRMKISPTDYVTRIEEVSKLDDFSVFTSSGLGKVYMAETKYGGPLLNVLDTLKNSQGSPVFRAYLFNKLVQIMKFQPDAWGLSFSPSVEIMQNRIHVITGGPIEDGDWLISSKTDAWDQKLKDLFAKDQSISYATEAKLNFTLSQQAVKTGLQFVGYVGMDGKPYIAQSPAPTDIWAYIPSIKKPGHFKGKALPLSPLFILPRPVSEYFSKAGIATGTASFEQALPPLFQTFN